MTAPFRELVRDSACAALFVASIVAATPRPAVAQDSTGVTYETPSGWKRSPGPRGLMSLMPQKLPLGRVVVVSVFAPEAFSGSPSAYHDNVVARVLGPKPTFLLPPTQSTVGGFSSTTVKVLAPPVFQVWLNIYTARWGDRGQAIVFYANGDNLKRDYQPTIEAMVGRIQVPGATADAAASANVAPTSATPQSGTPPTGTPPTGTPAAPIEQAAAPPSCYRPTGIEICPKTVVSGSRAVPIVGAYLAAGAQTSFSVDARDPGVKSRVTTTILLLFANGVAARTSAMSSGAIDANYWAEGFATMDATDPSSLGARSAGRWTEQNGTISIGWQSGPPSTMTRSGEALTEGSMRWAPYATVDGLRLEGRYERVVPFGPPWSVALHANGTFTSDGLNNTMGGTTINPGFPEHGGGTYEISKWSLILRFPNGFVQSINLLLGPGGPAAPADLVLNGHDYVHR
jgi:hypothetical protein